MTDPTPRQDPPPACDHDWQPDDSGTVPANGATNVRYCTRCDALDWDDAPPATTRALSIAFDGTDPTGDLVVFRWGETVGTDAGRTGAEIDLPVCGGDGRQVGEMRIGYANARVLMTMLCDTVTDAYEPSTEWVKRKRFDQFDDDQLEDLYDRLETAEQVIAGYRLRTQPETWERQAAELARQAKEIGEVRQRGVEALIELEAQRHGRDHLVRGIRMALDDLLQLDAEATTDEIKAALRDLLGQHRDRVHETSCPEHTGFKVCYCDCPTCRPGGVCACEHCKEWHPGHQETT